MPDPSVLVRHGGGGGADRRRGRSAARRSRSSATTTSTARPSAATLARFLRHGGIDPIIHIPDRLFEGYGPECRGDPRARRRAARRCWSPSIAAPPATSRWRRRARLGMETIVIDHHLADETLPPALAVVNPNRLDDLSKLGHLAAVGLVFMTVVAVNRELRRARLLERGAAGAGSARPARSGRARHRRRRGAAQGTQPRLRRQGTAGDAAARASRA